MSNHSDITREDLVAVAYVLYSSFPDGFDGVTRHESSLQFFCGYGAIVLFEKFQFFWCPRAIHFLQIIV